MNILGHPLIFGLACLTAMWGLVALTRKKFEFWAFVIGADGRPSTSKFQFLMWIAVGIFSYLAMWAARTHAANPAVDAALSTLPSNLLLAMGFSTGTLALAKGITVNQVNSLTVNKRQMTSPIWDPSCLFEDDLGYIDLGKLQLLVWTFVAIGLYLHQVVHAIYFNELALQKPIPDIDETLMVLMGLGHGAYLAKKAVGPDSVTPANIPQVVPKITAVSLLPISAVGDRRLVIAGSLFGARQGTSQVTINGRTLSKPITPGEWSDARISVGVPISLDGTSEWPSDGVSIQVSVVVAGVEGNRVQITADATS